MKMKMKCLHTLKEDPLIPFNRFHAFVYFFAVLAVVYHRFSLVMNDTSSGVPFSMFASLLVAELLFALQWFTGQGSKWRPVTRREFPERLWEMVEEKQLPKLDVFVCTADPYKEPPVNVVCTALSAMAFDYPTDRLSVYVSDDGCSELTLFAFMEAAKFALHWLPFCKDNNILVRSPEAYFNSSNHHDHSHQKIKIMYQDMKERIDSCMKRGFVSEDMIISQKESELFMKWKRFTRRDHPSIIEILLESDKDKDVSSVPLPNLIYLSREKSSKIAHNFKAGALNSLLRVSGMITNAPVILTLDCDMYSNDPSTPLRAMCYLLDPSMASDLAYVQFPQRFPGINDKDIYAAEIRHLFQINSQGLAGLCGPSCVGTNCFFNRRCFFGSPSSSSLHNDAICDAKNEGISYSILQKALDALSCRYEHGTKWGSSIGFQYESIVEDYNTGYRLQCRGWRSVFCEPERPAFFGDAPMSLNDALGQTKRWCVGLYEVGFSRYCPLTFGAKNVSFLAGLCYAYYSFWGLWSISITIYALLPQLALINHIPLFPKISDPCFYLYAYLFITTYAQELIEFMRGGSTFWKWWNEQRIWMIRGVTSFLFGSIEFTLKCIGISTPGFTVTNKVMEDDEQSERYNKGLYEFGVASPLFFPLAVVTIVNLSCFTLGVAEVLRKKVSFDEMFVQLFISGFVVLNSWPIYEAMFFRKDQGRMPTIVTVFGVCMTSLFVLLSFFLF
ncbi:cellulose synthase-like protein G3 [Dioscorea cayenensis subsp. rotundata]|uniref:Cellulose synthase-like protein G3 n=1 Tax=Dioscorea cayennensis subsp. rotundata TaxID=55577 RepID=A0AB40AQJ4_DIOCR|nr:cellulose synthase-like protein G3 [Dioscorea cayenensis subsp. rotundata]